MMLLHKSNFIIFTIMLSFVKTSSNTIVVTLAEKTTLTGTVYYLWKFVNDQDGSIDYCIATDLSLYTYRYNKFTITDQANPTPLSGQVSLQTGFGKYYVYEQASSTNLDPTGLTQVEEGKYLVTTTLPTEYSHTQTINEYVYNG